MTCAKKSRLLWSPTSRTRVTPCFSHTSLFHPFPPSSRNISRRFRTVNLRIFSLQRREQFPATEYNVYLDRVCRVRGPTKSCVNQHVLRCSMIPPCRNCRTPPTYPFASQSPSLSLTTTMQLHSLWSDSNHESPILKRPIISPTRLRLHNSSDSSFQKHPNFFSYSVLSQLSRRRLYNLAF